MVDRLGNILKGVASDLFTPYTGGETVRCEVGQHKEPKPDRNLFHHGLDQSGLHVRVVN